MYHHQQNKRYPQKMKGVYLPISKVHSILDIANLLAHYNIAMSNLLPEMGMILILNHLIFSDLDFDFKSSEIAMNFILKRIQKQNHFMTSYYN